MTDRFFSYLQREHARLEGLIAEESRRVRPDEAVLARLKKQKLLVKDQIARWRAEPREPVAA